MCFYQLYGHCSSLIDEVLYSVCFAYGIRMHDVCIVAILCTD